MHQVIAKTLAVVVAVCALASGAQAQSVTKGIVPFAAGGPSDSAGRIVVQRFNELFPAENAIVENRPGANGLIGARAVVQAPADGRTWLFADGALVTVNPSLYPKDPEFDAERDLRVVASVGMQPSMLVVNPAGPKTLKEFIELAKRQEVTYASAGVGSTGHLTMAYFGSVAGLKLSHIPYKGAAPAMTDLVGGQVQSAFNLISGPLPHVRSGKLRALAVSGGRRVTDLPDIPTVKESGYPEFEVLSGLFVMIPAKTPGDVTKSLEEKLQRVMDDPRVHERLRALAIEPAGLSPVEATKWLAADQARWSKLIRDYGIQGQR
jgi:tripartite-type tricarboxylate transporter receptor subunit TctC